jgi:hypothetical protein
MLKVDQAMDILDLHRQGQSIRAIAQATGFSRNTIRKVLRGQHPLRPPSPRRASKLEPYHDYLRQRRQEYGQPLGEATIFLTNGQKNRGSVLPQLKMAEFRNRNQAPRKGFELFAV